jgi:hypothetical protein
MFFIKSLSSFRSFLLLLLICALCPVTGESGGGEAGGRASGGGHSKLFPLSEAGGVFFRERDNRKTNTKS